MTPDLYSDPFGERAKLEGRPPLHLLGGRFHFESDSPLLLSLVDSAYADLPRHRLPGRAPPFKVRLLLAPGRPHPPDRQPRRRRRPEPPLPSMLCGPGLLGAATASSDFVVLSAAARAALVVLSRPMLGFPYHARYEFIEFTVFSLASRSLGLASLHAACVGRDGRGILLMGPSGSGKSTVTLLALLQGLEILSEDSVFVAPETLLATGVANFLHVRSDSLRWVARAPHAAAIRASPVIQRRSGIRKFEMDLRRTGYRLAPSPLKIIAAVFLSAQSAGNRARLLPLSASAMRARLTAAQAYAANQPGWGRFSRNVSKLEAFELRRGRHPLASVEALEELLSR
jgi:hypothetical protein